MYSKDDRVTLIVLGVIALILGLVTLGLPHVNEVTRRYPSVRTNKKAIAWTGGIVAAASAATIITGIAVKPTSS